MVKTKVITMFCKLVVIPKLLLSKKIYYCCRHTYRPHHYHPTTCSWSCCHLAASKTNMAPEPTPDLVGFG